MLTARMHHKPFKRKDKMGKFLRSPASASCYYTLPDEYLFYFLLIPFWRKNHAILFTSSDYSFFLLFWLLITRNCSSEGFRNATSFLIHLKWFLTECVNIPPFVLSFISYKWYCPIHLFRHSEINPSMVEMLFSLSRGATSGGWLVVELPWDV